MAGMRRRAFVSVIVLAVLCTAAATCGLLRRESTRALPAQSEAVTRAAVDPLTQFRTEREQLRARERSQLNDIIYNGSADPEASALAQRRLVSLLESEEQELNLEGVLQARGFDEVLAVARAESVTILVRGAPLTRGDTAVILDLVLRQTGVSGGNVKIIPIN